MVGGASVDAHMRQFLKVKGKSVKAVEGDDWNDERLDCPLGCEDAWRAFVELSEVRPTGFGPTPLGFTEIESWARLRQVELEQVEVDLIRVADRIWMEVNARLSDTRVKNHLG